MPPPPLPAPHPAVLMDEHVEEFLLRQPPEDPALLARAALVSRQWYRVVTGPSFRRRFRELHRSTPPLLGYIVSLTDSIRFVPLSSFRPPRTLHCGVRVISSSHGRVLLQRLSKEGLITPRDSEKVMDVHLSVWHPITDEQQDLPVVPVRPIRYEYDNLGDWDAAVVCAVGDDCDHLQCHKFMVVFMGSLEDGNYSCFYTSEAGSWSDPVFAVEGSEDFFIPGKCILIGTALYTTCKCTNDIVKYDLRTHQMCNISIEIGPGVPFNIMEKSSGSILIAAEEGRLAFAMATNSTLDLWRLREDGRLEEGRAIDLRTLLPADALPDPVLESSRAIVSRPVVIACAATGDGVIFLLTRVGCFTIDLKSGSCKKVWGSFSACTVPYVSFCTPASGAGVAITSDE